MKREDVLELHYIAPINNLRSILELGILSHNRAKSVPHHSVALESVQQKRGRIFLPNVTRLHSYVNLYFDARNPMMSYLRDSHQELVILRVRHQALDIPGTWIADGNSTARGKTKFYRPDTEGFLHLDNSYIFAGSWLDDDLEVKQEKKRRRCAEVLVPEVVPATFISGLFCSCDTVLKTLQQSGYNVESSISERMFFL